MADMTWASLDWAAFATMTGSVATLLAGGAAVIGAVIVGKLQADIAARQTQILERQIKLQEVETLSLLFDKRLAVYRTCIGSLEAMLRKSDAEFDKIRKEFHIEIANARFIFDSETSDMVTNIFKMILEYAQIRDRNMLRDQGIFKDGDQAKIQDIMYRGANMTADAVLRFRKVMSFPEI